MTEYINKAELMEQYPEFDGYTFADVTTIDIVHCGECKHGRSYFVNRWACEHPQHNTQWHNTNWFCADGERKE